MAAIKKGDIAPDFSWKATDGKTYTLKHALTAGPQVVAFFKVGCPTCQFTFPFLERISTHFGNVLGVSQDEDAPTRRFAAAYNVTFPLLLEDTDAYPTSNAYGIAYVPTIFLVNSDGRVLMTSTGFSRQELIDLSARMASLTGKGAFTPFKPGEDVPATKSG